MKNYIGQSHLVGNGMPINRMIKNNSIQSMILYGNPGIGKTMLANIISKELNMQRYNLNAATCSLGDIKEAVSNCSINYPVCIVLDEIHRLDKSKQNYLLPFTENNSICLIGTTTENPYYAVNSALRSRLLIFELYPLTSDEVIEGLKSFKNNIKENYAVPKELYDVIYRVGNGDMRLSINILKFVIQNYEPEELNANILDNVFKNSVVYDKKEGNHHDLKSAFQKSIRASDLDAALHYLARLLKMGDDVALLRRLSVIAYEDIGLANPQACANTMTAINAFKELGMPEGRIPLANAVVELCLSPKSTSAYRALDRAFNDLETKNIAPIPYHLRKVQPPGFEYDMEHAAQIDNLPHNLKNSNYFDSMSNSRYEQALHSNYLKRKRNLIMSKYRRDR